MGIIIPFARCALDAVRNVGGKAAGLGELERAGFPVPPGFAITTAAYRRSVGPIAGEIVAILSRGAGGPEADERACEGIEALFGSLSMDAEVAAEIDQAYRQLCGPHDGPVAVRSSATAEDAADASFAGQQETYLWITGAEAVRRHVMRCWASLFTARAIAYRARLAVPPEDLAMGVVVQRMVAAEAAGVMMTLEPVSGDRSCIYIESAFGLGEAIVRGDVEPDRFHIDKEALTLRSETIACKQVAWRFVPEEGAVRPVALSLEDQAQPSLSGQEAVALARLGREIEGHFGRAMDVEWAVAANPIGGARHFFMLQARPETIWSNRAPVEAPEAVIGRRDAWDPLNGASLPQDYWTTSNIGEAAPGVQTPLSWTAWWPVGEDAQREAAYRLGVFTAAERRTPVERPEECFNGVFYGRLAIRLRYMAIFGDRLPGTTGPAAVESVLGRVPEDMTFHPIRRRYPLVAWRLLQGFFTIPGELRALTADQTAWWRQSLAEAPQLDLGASIRLFLEAKTRFGRGETLQIRAVLGTVQPMFALLEQLAKTTGIGEARTLGGVSGNAEMAVVRDLWEVSRGRMSLEQVIAEHGFHGPAEGELSSRVWREDDVPLRRMAEQYAARDEALDPSRRNAEHQSDRERIEAQVIAATPWVRRSLTRLMLWLARRYLPLRGVAKKSFLQAFDIMRATARRIGELRAAAGAFDHADDVFYLTVEELTGVFPSDARNLVRLRRARREAYQGLEIPGNWQGTPEARVFARDNGAGAIDTLQGIGVSRGVVEGRARVLSRPDFSQVQSDEILVAPTTDPSWSSIMFVSAALVVDIGGALSHAAVVAREMNIPCVVNTRNGTAVLRTGDRLRVDGQSGVVQVLERAKDSTKL